MSSLRVNHSTRTASSDSTQPPALRSARARACAIIGARDAGAAHRGPLIAFVASMVIAAAAAEPALALAITAVRIVSVTPNPIPCGGAAVVTVDIDYFVNAWETLPQTGDVDLWDDDTFGDERLDTTTFTINVGDAQRGTKRVFMTVQCDPPDADCNCVFRGPLGADDEGSPHELYANVPAKGVNSGNVDVNCQKPNGTLALNDTRAETGDLALVTGAALLETDLRLFDIRIAYPAGQLDLISAELTPQTLALLDDALVDTSTPGIVRLFGASDAPIPAPAIEWRLVFVDTLLIPFENRKIFTTPDSVLLGAAFEPLKLSGALSRVSIVPPDVEAPIINRALIQVDPGSGSVFGIPGAIWDEVLLQEWEIVRARLGIPGPFGIDWLGASPVFPNGAFQINNLGPFPPDLPLLIEASDGLGNSRWLPLGPAPCPGDVNCDGAVNFQDIDPFVAALSGGAIFPCGVLNADVNGDGAVNFADIDAFVAAIGTTCL